MPTWWMPSSRALAGWSGGGATVIVTLIVVVTSWVAVTVMRVGSCSPPVSLRVAVPTTAATAVITTPAAVSTAQGHNGHLGCDVDMAGSLGYAPARASS